MEKCIENIIDSNPNEQVKMIVRRHWLVFAAMMTALFIILILPIITIFIIGIYFPIIYTGIYFSIIIVFIFAYLLFLLGSFLVGYIKYYFDLVIVTNKRIIDIQQVSLFHRNIEELEILHIENVSASTKGVFQTFFNFGDVVVETAAENPNFHFQTIPNPQEFARKIMQLYEELISEHKSSLKKIDDAEGLNRWKHGDSYIYKLEDENGQNQQHSGELKPGEEKKLPNNGQQQSGQNIQAKQNEESEKSCHNPDDKNDLFK